MPKPLPKTEPPPQFEIIDLRAICRGSDKHQVVVFMEDDEDRKVEWLRLGQADLLVEGRHNNWVLKSYLGAESPDRGVPTDFEHDSAYACVLPLIAVQLDMISYHCPIITAYIDPDLGTWNPRFHVPDNSDYDPRKHPEATSCKDKSCLRVPVKDGGGPHTIVPEGLYVPKFNPELYAKVRGKRVEIRFFHPRDAE